MADCLRLSLLLLFGILAFELASAVDCTVKATTVPKRFRKKLRVKNRWRTNCQNTDGCVWNFRKKRCVDAPSSCRAKMKADCDKADACYWRPNQEGANWKVRNIKNRVRGLCLDKPANYDESLCRWKQKPACLLAPQCSFDSNRQPKCQLKPNKTPPPTSPPTIACNPNNFNGLVCNNDNADTSGLPINFNFCGGFENRKYCPVNWAKCGNGKCVQSSNSGCDGFGGLALGFEGC